MATHWKKRLAEEEKHRRATKTKLVVRKHVCISPLLFSLGPCNLASCFVSFVWLGGLFVFCGFFFWLANSHHYPRTQVILGGLLFVAVILFSLNGLGKDEGALSEQVPVHARSPGKPVIRPGDPLPRYHKDMEQQQESPADIGQVRREQEQQKQAQAQEPQVGGPFDEEENPDYTGEPKERFLHPVEFSYAPDENDLVKKVTTSTERETHTDTQTHTDTHGWHHIRELQRNGYVLTT